MPKRKNTNTYGLRPSVTYCFYCHRPKDAGLQPSDKHKKILEDYLPCDTCEKMLESGITLVGTSDRPLAYHMPIKGYDPPVYPTGTWANISEEMFKELFDGVVGQEFIDEVLDARLLPIDGDVVDEIVKRAKRKGGKNAEHDT